MRKISIILSVVISALVLSACGGNGNSAPSPFTGVYDGTWSATNGSVGTAHLTILSSGHVSGPVDNTTTSVTGSFSGTIKPDGTISGVYKNPSIQDVQASGTWALSNNGLTLIGNLIAAGGSATYTLTKQ